MLQIDTFLGNFQLFFMVLKFIEYITASRSSLVSV